jgi:hypothetical protein
VTRVLPARVFEHTAPGSGCNEVLLLIGELRTQSSTWYTVRKLLAGLVHVA